ncbi:MULTISPECIES: EFR1 family ferrodoxin [unclassified Pseudodesulfovibrio]|uniref:EFR1 family ferrodoxin n=1 Tax=unclassified Pseudodesulfovibrio TaxID=2661612 RepID=UPI000FEB88A7|nr:MULTISPECIES: EFR1 family ferrodoxin [unclassified Pseudodesulfovibrio]MCJ2165328.1 EFR1 family ferrodoxin [Pseudodesulfovibrio sp. S3-i]RWU02486.1 ferredoxin [Pseudodesulfovibrio sp. S3]
MKMESVKLVCFSPTGTTRAVVRGIADGLGPVAVELIDITRPEARRQPLRTSENELLVVAVPVYMGRVPALLNEWLNALQGHDTPAVCVVVYGNRAYENALLELKDIVSRRGCVPIAGAAYVGEHSFSNSEEPTAQGRPDEEDLKHAARFGRRIREKLDSVSSMAEVREVEVPGSYPYEGRTELWNVDFIQVSDQCAQCGLCAELCPVGAVDPQNSAAIDQVKCITCCACIKSCPQGARSMKPGPVKDAAIRLFTLYKEPKKPEFFV